MKFNEETLEKAVLTLFEDQGYEFCTGNNLARDLQDVLIRDDLKNFLKDRYKKEKITDSEIESLFRTLDSLPSSAVYESNRNFLRMISDGFVLPREDKTQKDIFLQLLDFENIEKNSFKIVNQLEIQGYENRIPDLIVYVNGIPLVVLELKSAVRENATIEDAFKQLTIRYLRDIPELFKYNAFCVISDGVNNKSEIVPKHFEESQTERFRKRGNLFWCNRVREEFHHVVSDSSFDEE